MIAHQKTLLLDMDGVVMRKKPILTHVANNVVKYVRKYAPKMRSMAEAAELNEFLYSNYGHTHRGMRALFGKTVPDLDGFNKFVYDKDLLNYVCQFRDDEEVRQQTKQLQSLLHTAKDAGVPTYIFSNAPNVWCNNALAMMGLLKDIPEENVFGSSHPVFDGGALKPDRVLYERLNLVLHSRGDDSSTSTIIFVDDSVPNLLPVMGRTPVVSGWHPVWLMTTPNTFRLDAKLMHKVSEIQQVASLL